MNKKEFFMSLMLLVGTMVFTAACSSDSESAEQTPPPSAEDEAEERIETVIPTEMREDLGQHMTLYSGVTPPNIEGVYLLKPMIALYCSEMDAGWEAAPATIRFLNQNAETNTIDIEEEEGSQYTTGEGAFISGTGDNFTIYFNTYTTSTQNSWHRRALVISGTKVDGGIKDMQYAFVMVERGEDYVGPMGIGDMHVFHDSDGMSENTNWTLKAASPRKAAENGYGTNVRLCTDGTAY